MEVLALGRRASDLRGPESGTAEELQLIHARIHFKTVVLRMETIGHLRIIHHARIVETPVCPVCKFKVRNQIVRTRIGTLRHFDPLRGDTPHRSAHQQKEIQHVAAVKRDLRNLKPEISRLLE